MTRPTADHQPQRTGIRFAVTGGLAAVVAFFFVTGIVAHLNTRTISRSARQVSDTHEVLATHDELLSLMKDAETGQRGFVITGEERYLETYSGAVARLDERFRHTVRLTSADPDQNARLLAIRAHIDPS